MTETQEQSELCQLYRDRLSIVAAVEVALGCLDQVHTLLWSFREVFRLLALVERLASERTRRARLKLLDV